MYSQTLNKICEFLENEGKLAAKIIIEKSNLNSLKGAEKAGFTIYGEGKFLKRLNYKFWRETYFEQNDNTVDYLSFQKNKWDSLAEENLDDPIKAVISKDDLNNYYFDYATKRALTQIVELKQDFKVLDYGCGVGRISLWMSPKVASIEGLDISPKMIEIAKKVASEMNLKNLEFNVTDGKSVNFKDEQFDLIICCVALKYIIDDNDLEDILKEFSRVTKIGGCVVIIDEIDKKGPTLSFDGPSIKALLRQSEHYISILNRYNMELIGEFSLFLNFFTSKYNVISLIIGIKNYRKFNQRLLKKVINLDLFVDDKFKKFKSKKGFHRLYFKKTSK